MLAAIPDTVLHFPVANEWDPRKARSNERKHGVTFEQAALVFGDPLALIEDDSHHEDGRELILGKPYPARRDLLLVVFIEVREDVIRIISARQATAAERRRYEEGR